MTVPTASEGVFVLTSIGVYIILCHYRQKASKRSAPIQAICVGGAH
jgi:hypothetical protein